MTVDNTHGQWQIREQELIKQIAIIIGRMHGETKPCMVCKMIAEEIGEVIRKALPELAKEGVKQ